MHDERGYRRALLLLTVLLGISLGVLYVLLMRYRQISAYAPIVDAANVISKNYYYFDQEGGEDALIDASLRGMISGIRDDYAQYYTAQEYDAMLVGQSGSYVGVGILMLEPDEIGALIQRVYDDSPMAHAGAQAGDYIIEVNGTLTAGLSLDAVTSLFSADMEKEDCLLLLRGEEKIEVSVKSAEVYVPYVSYRMLNDEIGYMQIEAFQGKVAQECETAIAALLQQGMKSLVLDLRGNPGGGLVEVLDVADLFFQKDVLIVTIKSRIEETEYYYAEDDGYTFPMAVLVDAGSASASELLSGALQDHDRAAVIGTRTYGKGIVQTFYRLNSNGGWVKITTDAYYTPNDVCIHGVGITPDMTVELPEGITYYPSVQLLPEQDTQLQAAIAYLHNG